jgi:hypothetical protein
MASRAFLFFPFSGTSLGKMTEPKKQFRISDVFLIPLRESFTISSRNFFMVANLSTFCITAALVER